MKRFVGVVLFLFAAAAVAGIAFGQSGVYLENFDDAVAPAFSGSILSADASWKSSTSSSSPGSGGNNAVHTGSNAGNLVLGPVDLSFVLSGTFSYYARRTSSYPADSLIVRASLDGGSSFPFVLFGGGLPSSASTYELISVSLPDTLIGESSVQIMFDARGGSSSGSNIRIDDVSFDGTIDSSSIPASFGFERGDTTWNLADSTLQVGFDLSWPGPDSIRGFQFDIEWDSALISVDSILANPSVLPSSDWSLAQSIGSGSAQVAVLNLVSDGWAPGGLNEMLRVHLKYVGPALGADSLVSIDLSGLIVTNTSAMGDELSLPLGERTLSLTLSPARPLISLSSSALDFGVTQVGDSVSVALTIFNTLGSADLALTYGFPTLDVVSFAGPAAVSAGSQEVFNIWFKPTASSYGALSGEFVIYHNALGDSSVVSVDGVGTGGRGDADVDGAFDVADVILSLDESVSSTPLSGAVLARHDLHPFPAGNGQVDIRDVTVGIQAILFDEWPDGASLPTAPLIEGPAQKWRIARLIADEAGLWLETSAQLRGMQITMETVAPLAFVEPGKSGISVSDYFDREKGIARTVLLVADDSPLDTGMHHLAHSGFENMVLQSGLVVDLYGQKHHIELETIAVTSTDLGQLPGDSFSVFPNPVLAGGAQPVLVHVPESFRGVSIIVFDSIGRRIHSFDASGQRGDISLGSDIFSAPGLYFIRIEALAIGAEKRKTSIKKATTISIIAAR